MVRKDLEKHLEGRGQQAAEKFFAALPGLPREQHPDLLIGMGYNFEFYDALFALAASHVQLSMESGDYAPRYRAMQQLLRPFCSEYGIETKRPLMKTHRELYAEFYRKVTGGPMPERYPSNGNPWLAASRRWARRMTEAVACDGEGALDRAKFNIGYLWAVEYLSIAEFTAMRESWARQGFEADYLDAHCAVEEEHAEASMNAVMAFASASDPVVARAIRVHERDFAGYYRELYALLKDKTPVLSSVR